MKPKVSKKLHQLAATAICGNDISSSVLYVSALSIAFAGQYAWITLLIVSLVLFLFRKIYGEVVGALPLNGGAYNALLNTTSKRMASFAATLTILSYMATAVISANEGIHYLHHLLPSIPILISTVCLLLFFALLSIVGITESSTVAIAIFIFHLITLAVLFFCVGSYLFQHGLSTFHCNWHTPSPKGIGYAIFFGFSASMLGVSGFESSANFVEEQARGVFPKTLRNMWVIVSIINPLAAVFALALFDIPTLQEPAFQNTLLIKMGDFAGGSTLSTIIALDAFLVLSGAVLTSFVGVTGLLERMTLDRIMPKFFLKKNKQGSSYRIILVFFLLACSVLFITRGNVALLAGVYTLSFLSVMALFGIGNILLKQKRSSLPRPESAPWLGVLLAISAVLVALTGNLLMPPKDNLPSNFLVFLEYFIPTIIFVFIMLNRTQLLKLGLKLVYALFNPFRKFVLKTDKKINQTINSINNQEFIFFTKGDNIATLNSVMLYIQKNEHTKKIKIVHIRAAQEPLLEELAVEIHVLDKEYPDISIQFLEIEGVFSPELIEKLSKKWDIPINFMFIGSPGEHFPYKIEELGGVRLII
ncbi:Amino acid permease [Tenacibaculum litopenaei]|uniref:APC family permease n=1 Tax=Tenacibaculum litopenaei TaxID=396016 RepID=UPI003895E976